MADEIKNNKGSVIINKSTVNVNASPEKSRGKAPRVSARAIKKLIGNGQLEAAFDALEQQIELSEDNVLENDFYNLQNQFRSFSRQEGLNQLQYNAAEVIRNKLVNGLLQLIDNLERKPK